MKKPMVYNRKEILRMLVTNNFTGVQYTFNVNSRNLAYPDENKVRFWHRVGNRMTLFPQEGKNYLRALVRDPIKDVFTETGEE